MTVDTSETLDRRSFLRSASGVATVAAVAIAIAPSMVTEAQAYDPGEDETRAKYQPDAADVQAFYRSNGYETLKDK
ncbi:MAG: formate dehydrogenase [Rhizobiaceae bacterium]|nr:formate dehydrogenase [Rhizobiaceae bacterium]